MGHISQRLASPDPHSTAAVPGAGDSSSGNGIARSLSGGPGPVLNDHGAIDISKTEMVKAHFCFRRSL